jgi:hypothetical protein
MKSPYHKHIAYVLMRPSDAEGSSLVARKKQACTCSMDSGSIDGFMGNVEAESESGMYYKPLDLPVITSCGELDESYYDSTIVDLVNTSGLTENEAKDIYLASGNAWMKLKKAFRIANRRRLSQSAPSVNAANHAADFKMGASELDVQVNGRNKSALEIDAAFALTGPATDVRMGDFTNVGSSIDVDGITNNMMESVTGEYSDIPVDQAGPDSIDVDEATFVEEEFEGSDAFDLDDVKANDDLEIDSKAEIEV